MPPTKRKTRKKAAKPRKRPAKAAQTLAPETTPAEYPGSARVFILSSAQTAGVRVTEDTALTYAAVWACVKVISEDLAVLPWRVHRQAPGGDLTVQPEHPVDWLLHVQPNPETAAFQFKEAIVAHALTWGNGYAEIERDRLGRPLWLWQLTPDRVTPFRDDAGQLAYAVRNYGGPDGILPAADVYHLKGPGYDGLVGYDVVAYAARVVGRGLAIDTYAGDLYANDSTPGGVLTHPGKLSDTARDNLRETWTRLHGGPKNRRRVAILEEGMGWSQTSLPPETARLIEESYLTVEDVCRIFRVPPHKIAHLLRSTNNNIEHQSIEYVTDCLMPWAGRLESEGNLKLFGRQQRGVYFTKLNLKGRLRGDTAAQTTHLQQMMDRGVYNVDEARDYLDLNAIGAKVGGDKRLVQQNMTTLQKVGEDPLEPLPPSPPDPEPPSGAGGQQGDAPELGTRGRAAMMAAALVLTPVLEDAVRRVLRREEHRAKDALARLDDPADVWGWYEAFEEEHRGYLADTLRPAVHALAGRVGGAESAADAAIAVYAGRHLAKVRESLAQALKPDSAVDFAAHWVSAAAELRDCVLAACAASSFDPSQPRDKEGQWSEGGGASTGGGVAGSGSERHAQEDRETDRRRERENREIDRRREREDDVRDRRRAREDARREGEREREDERTHRRQSAEEERAARPIDRERDREHDRTSDRFAKEDDARFAKVERAKDEHGKGSAEHEAARREYQQGHEERRARQDEAHREIDKRHDQRIRDEVEKPMKPRWEEEGRQTAERRHREDEGVAEKRRREDGEIEARRTQEDREIDRRRKHEDEETDRRRRGAAS